MDSSLLQGIIWMSWNGPITLNIYTHNMSTTTASCLVMKKIVSVISRRWSAISVSSSVDVAFLSRTVILGKRTHGESEK